MEEKLDALIGQFIREGSPGSSCTCVVCNASEKGYIVAEQDAEVKVMIAYHKASEG